jgi:hypothetical protein
MNPDPGMSPEDQATFERLAADLNVEASAAAAGPPSGEQLAALRQAVERHPWHAHHRGLRCLRQPGPDT